MSNMFKKVYALLIAAAFGFSSMANAQQSKGNSTSTPADFEQLVEAINSVMHQHHYNIRELEGEGYQTVLNDMRVLAKSVDSKQAFMAGFETIWRDGPFSHVVLGNSRASAEQVAHHLDNMNVGGQGALLSWREKVAVLTVNTMMGQDTIKQIKQHYKKIAEKQARALIIDLRSNEGGAFAIRPLVSHLIKQPVEAGFFMAQKWSSAHQRLPTKNELADIAPWRGWSILAFWRDVQQQALVKVQFEPAYLQLDIPVYVLTSNKTASASELATEALQSAGRVTVVGEATAGQMLSQKPYDLPMGLQLYVPVADYYSINTGRLEGNPIIPDVKTSAGQAMEKALQLATQ